jgi:hypothetical protein
VNDDEPTRPNGKGLENSGPKRESCDAMLGKMIKPWHDGSREIEDTAL